MEAVCNLEHQRLRWKMPQAAMQATWNPAVLSLGVQIHGRMCVLAQYFMPFSSGC